jgi:hypothetical protein
LSGLRRIATALRPVAAAALVVAGSGALVRAATAAFDPFRAYPGHTSAYGAARARAIRAVLTDIAARPGKQVLVLGGSGVARAFVPSAFDAAFAGGEAAYESYNLGQILLQPETALAMSKVIRRAYTERGKRVGMTIFGISVPELARGSLNAARQAVPDQAYAFTNVDTLRAQAHVDSWGALSDGLSYLLYGNVRPSRVGMWIDDWITDRAPPCESGFKQPPDGEDAKQAFQAYCEELRREHPRGVPPWNPQTHGGFDFGLPTTRPMLERLVDRKPAAPPAPSSAPLASFVDIDENGLRSLIAAVRELKAVSVRVFVLCDIINPAQAATISPTLLHAWRQAAERIAYEGGAVLLDFNDGTFAPADFGDRTHLHPMAAERFSALLADRVKAAADEDRAAR